jgi:hypothetical protein
MEHGVEDVTRGPTPLLGLGFIQTGFPWGALIGGFNASSHWFQKVMLCQSHMATLSLWEVSKWSLFKSRACWPPPAASPVG